MPPVASRRGRRIASKACDACRERKVQCVFDGERSSCRRCTQGNTGCTFLKERRARGPPARVITIAQNLPIGELLVEHLCPRDVFRAIIHDYLDLVWPLLPLLHRPCFEASLSCHSYDTDPATFRLCVALCAVTVASIPRKFEQYSGSRYSDVASMVDRACHLVLLSRVQSAPDWQNQPSMTNMLVSILLSMASHYAGRHSQGWGYASEAIQFFQSLELFRREGYAKLTVLEEQLCKRAFWVLYIIQIHDRLSFIVPHTGLSFNPSHTDWEFLIPSQVEDEEIPLHDMVDLDHPVRVIDADFERPLPVISGFIALIKVFLCVVDFLSNGFPGAPPQVYAMTAGSLQNLVSPASPMEHPSFAPSSASFRSTVDLNSLLLILRRLQRVIEELPTELKIPSIDDQNHSSNATIDLPPIASNQFDIMRANIHVTSLYIQSKILEVCLGAFTGSSTDENAATPDDDLISSPGSGSRTQLWRFRESIAHELLQVLHFCSSRTLEANGSSMIVKIREIAATLLDNEHELDATEYVVRFADILADLDHMGYSTIISPLF